MKLVVQEDEYGCSVGCVANILGISYEKSLSLFGINAKEKAGTEGFYCKDIVGALNSGGLLYKYKYIKPRLRGKIYKDGSIVFIKRSERYRAGHFLSRKSGAWQDPWINFPQQKRLSRV